MKRSRSMTLACVLAVGSPLLAGCGGSDTSPKKEPMPMEQTVYGEQIKQMNRIRDEATRLSSERMDHLNRQLESQEGRKEDDKEDQAQ